ncbi:4Fe-4S single cluster domain-containing protein [Succinimonas amylolytica]|uniref:4Fe-4S single cluster domain-containing protein n=1 Tax=Succinimonas amylolytica TaxID=83769 RepID=UPI000365565E|nr:4Fe-4S single cluster domain-containing protein [Succinimonas amylolytica]
MYIARLLYPVRVLGPGRRVGIWFAGCSRRCRGCSNPELWERDPRFLTDRETVLRMIAAVREISPVDGFTLTGGDPFEQPEALRELLPALREISPDILAYTGYRISELRRRGYQDILDRITVLIDGSYREEWNTGCFLRGSDNQEIHILDRSRASFYGEYLRNGRNEVQNFRTRDGFISVGIHRPEYPRELREALRTRGVTIGNPAAEESAAGRKPHSDNTKD